MTYKKKLQSVAVAAKSREIQKMEEFFSFYANGKPYLIHADSDNIVELAEGFRGITVSHCASTIAIETGLNNDQASILYNYLMEHDALRPFDESPACEIVAVTNLFRRAVNDALGACRTEADTQQYTNDLSRILHCANNCT